MLCRASRQPSPIRKVPKKKPGCLCRAFPLPFPRPSNVFARISLTRKLVKRGGTGAQNGPQAKLGPVLLGRHSGSRATVVMGFPSPSQVMGYPKPAHQGSPKRNRKPRFSPPVRGFFYDHSGWAFYLPSAYVGIAVPLHASFLAVRSG